MKNVILFSWSPFSLPLDIQFSLPDRRCVKLTMRTCNTVFMDASKFSVITMIYDALNIILFAYFMDLMTNVFFSKRESF